MRQTVSFRRTWPLAVYPAPAEPISDGDLTIRLPVAADIGRLAELAADPAELAGYWVGAPPPDSSHWIWARNCVEGWQKGWTKEGSELGPAFIVDAGRPLVGIINLCPRSDKELEILYGVLPSARGQGIATNALVLARYWAATMTGFERLFLQIDEENGASQRVAEKAGFVLQERVEIFVVGTRQTHNERRYTYAV